MIHPCTSSTRRGDRISRITPSILAAVWALLVTVPGIPVLRHDWAWPLDANGFVDLFVSSTSGWSSGGFGHPSAAPTGYLVGPMLAVLGLILGSRVALTVFLFAIALLAAQSATQIASRLRAPPLPAMLFAVFNPWVFAKLVAGHLYMLVGYGAIILMLSELIAERPRVSVLVPAVILSLCQLQFYVVALGLSAIYWAWRRDSVPCGAALAIAAPVFIGVVAERGSLLSTPFTLSWQSAQSLAPANAVRLIGDFATYTASFALYGGWLLWLCPAIAAMGVVAGWRNASLRVVGAATLFALLVTMGTRGPLASLYTAGAAQAIPLLGLYRELYDVSGIAAIGYLVLACHAVSRIRALFAVWSLLGVSLLVPWFVAPAWRFWVNATQLPQARITVPENTRFALFPAFQPLSLDGQGSGLDPEAIARPGNRSPLNSYLAVYPEVAALGSANDRLLAGLSVAAVISRRPLKSDRSAVYEPDDAHSGARRMLRSHEVHPIPELSLLPLPAVGALLRDVGGGNVLFADVSGLRGDGIPASWARLPRPTPLVADNRWSNPARGWVDARLVFANAPAVAQAYGGVATRSSAPYRLAAGAPVLAWVKGELRSWPGGRRVARTTHGYRWVHIPANVSRIVCRGFCVLAVQATSEREIPLEAAPHAATAVAFRAPIPWLAVATVDRGSSSMIRYNVRFDPGWQAFTAFGKLPHVRVDGVSNGWFLPKQCRTCQVVMVHVPSLLQAVAEIFGAGVVVMWISSAVRRLMANRRARRELLPNVGAHVVGEGGGDR